MTHYHCAEIALWHECDKPRVGFQAIVSYTDIEGCTRESVGRSGESGRRMAKRLGKNMLVVCRRLHAR